MTDWKNPRTVSHRDTSLSFAVRLEDAFTGERPDEGVGVALASGAAEPVRNASGYLLFLDLSADVVRLTVDGGDRYRDETRTVVLDGEPPDDAPDEDVVVVADPSEPVVVELSPTPAYEFPSSATVVRGHVRDAAGDPVEGARVSLREFPGRTTTTDTGEYALFVPVSAENVRRRDGENVVAVDGDEPADARAVADGGPASDPTIVVTHPDYDEVTERVEVAAGTRTVHYVTIE